MKTKRTKSSPKHISRKRFVVLEDLDERFNSRRKVDRNYKSFSKEKNNGGQSNIIEPVGVERSNTPNYNTEEKNFLSDFDNEIKGSERDTTGI